MNATSPWLRPLQVLAAALGVAIVVLGLACLNRDLPPPPVAAAAGAIPNDAGVTAATAERRAVEAPASASLPAVAAAPTPLAAPTEAVLFGAVRRADGSPVADGYCWLSRDGKPCGRASLRTGRFAFAGLQPGVHRLTSRIPDELALDREIVVRAPSTRFDLELAPRWVLHVNAVTADGAPLVEALGKDRSFTFSRTLRALASPAPLAGNLPSSGSSDWEAGLGPFRSNDPIRMRGQQALPKQTIGVLTMPVDQPVHIALLLGSVLLAQQAAPTGQESVTFVLAPEAVLGKSCTVRFRVVDPQGAPVVGALAGTGPKDVTDEQGRFVARELLPGRAPVDVWHEKLRMPPLQTELAPGTDVDFGDITMQPGVDLELSFADLGDQGSMQLFWLDAPAGSRWQATEHYVSAQNGAGQKVSLYPGRYGVRARGKNGVALLEIDTAALPPGPLRPVLSPGASLQIDNRIGTGFARFEITTARGVPVHRGELGSRPGYALELPPGDYLATVDTGIGPAIRRPFTLPAGGCSLQLP